jgi:hypothetical protein
MRRPCSEGFALGSRGVRRIALGIVQRDLDGRCRYTSARVRVDRDQSSSESQLDCFCSFVLADFRRSTPSTADRPESPRPGTNKSAWQGDGIESIEETRVQGARRRFPESPSRSQIVRRLPANECDPRLPEPLGWDPREEVPCRDPRPLGRRRPRLLERAFFPNDLNR